MKLYLSLLVRNLSASGPGEVTLLFVIVLHFEIITLLSLRFFSLCDFRAC